MGDYIKNNIEFLFFILLFIAGVVYYIISNYLFNKKVKKGLSIKTKKGHFVQSYGEKVIANFLYDNNIKYMYDKQTRFSFFQFSRIRPDFYLIDYNIYIEYWGMAGDEDYDSKTEWKKIKYKKYNKRLINLYSNQVKVIPGILKKELSL